MPNAQQAELLFDTLKQDAHGSLLISLLQKHRGPAQHAGEQRDLEKQTAMVRCQIV